MKTKLWIKKHEPCLLAIKWLKNYDTMAEAWEACERSDWMLWAMEKDDIGSDKDLRLFACWCVRQVWNLLTDERSRNAVIVAERFANGMATKEELEVARFAAWSAAESAAELVAELAAESATRVAAESAARLAAWSAAWAFAESAARLAAWSATRFAAWSATRVAAWAFAESAANKKQADKLREMFNNPYKK